MHAEFGASLEVPESAAKIDKCCRAHASSGQELAFNDKLQRAFVLEEASANRSVEPSIPYDPTNANSSVDVSTGRIDIYSCPRRWLRIGQELLELDVVPWFDAAKCIDAIVATNDLLEFHLRIREFELQLRSSM